RQRRRIAFRPRVGRSVEWRHCLGRHHPWRDGGAEILAEERAERLGFPGLYVARRPVVEQAVAEHMIGRVTDRNHGAELGSDADEGAELELEIEIARRSVARRIVVLSLALAERPLDRRAADAHRR